jgi:hypothetical protein
MSRVEEEEDPPPTDSSPTDPPPAPPVREGREVSSAERGQVANARNDKRRKCLWFMMKMSMMNRLLHYND